MHIISAMFESWLNKKHPYHWVAMDVCYSLLLVALVVSVVLIWFVDWWWKLLISSFVLILVIRFFHQVWINAKIEEFRSK